MILRGFFLLQPSDSPPLGAYSFRAHIEMRGPLAPDPSCSNAPPKIKVYQSSIHYQPANIVSYFIIFLAIDDVAFIHPLPTPSSNAPSFPTTRTIAYT